MKRHEDLGGWPAVTTADAKAAFWLLVFALLFIAVTAVSAPQ